VLTDSADTKQYIKRMRARDSELNSKWGTICTPVEMKAFDGKRRKVQAADLQGIFPYYPVHPIQESEACQTLGRSVISSDSASDHLRPIEDIPAQELPFEEDKK